MRNPFAGGASDHENSTFLPEDYVERQSQLRANILFLALFAVVMFGVVSAFFVTNRQWLTIRNEREEIIAQYTQEAARIEQLKALEEQKAEVTTALLEKVPRSVLLAELITRMPREITLLELSLDSKRLNTASVSTPPRAPAQQKGSRTGSLTGRAQAASAPETRARVVPPKFEFTIKLQGVSPQNTYITDYLASLIECQLLESVDLVHIRRRVVNDVPMREFEITARIREDADARSIDPITDLEQGSNVRTGDTVSSAEGADGEKE